MPKDVKGGLQISVSVGVVEAHLVAVRPEGFPMIFDGPDKKIEYFLKNFRLRTHLFLLGFPYENRSIGRITFVPRTI